MNVRDDDAILESNNMQIIICVAKISTAQSTDKPIHIINQRHIPHSLPIHIGIYYANYSTRSQWIQCCQNIIMHIFNCNWPRTSTYRTEIPWYYL